MQINDLWLCMIVVLMKDKHKQFDIWYLSVGFVNESYLWSKTSRFYHLFHIFFFAVCVCVSVCVQ